MYKVIKLLILSSIIVSCARMSIPGGGPVDFNPPKFLGSTPAVLSTNIDPQIKEIRLNFDEYVVVKDISKQVIISPPPRVTPSIEPSSVARKYVTIRFFEPLMENTTYTINFGSSIQDNNEGNKLENFSYIFSTGNKIDSLQVSGQLKPSLKREFDPSIVVALYKIEGDSINLKNKPYYITRADSIGRFRLEHLHEGDYRLISFMDSNSNLILDPEKEMAGFSTEIVNPLTPVDYEIILSPLKQNYRSSGAEQEGQGVIKFRFKGNPKDVQITSLQKDFPSFKKNHTPYSDSLYIYFNTNELKNIERRSQLKFTSEYQAKKDTLNVLYDMNTETELALSPVDKEITPSSYFVLKSNNYLSNINKERINVYKNQDSTDFIAEIDTLDFKNVHIKFPIAYDSNYRIVINSEAIEDFLGQKNQDTLTYNIKTKKPSEYGNLSINVQNKPDSNYFFQLLTERYEVIESIYGKNDTFNFKDLKPGRYRLRILVDENNNGIWDIADIDNFIPAEKTYIYPNVIEVRAFWNLNEVWLL